MIYALIASLLLLAIPLPTNAQYFGKFVGTATVEFLPNGRDMRLTKDFSYIDPAGGEWRASAGSIIDGASIPQFVWSFIGGPFEGKYRDASIIHDIACNLKQRPWELVHLTFYNAMRASDVHSTLARIMYAGVYHFGPRWSHIQELPSDSGAQKKAIQELQNASDRRSEVIVQKVPRPPIGGSLPSPRMIAIVTPMKSQLNETDFSTLRAQIERSAETAAGEMFLEEIRNYVPEGK